MNEPAGLQHIDGSLLGPVIQSLPIDALMCCGVGDRDPVTRAPLEGDEPDVAVTHGTLAEEIDAVLWQG